MAKNRPNPSLFPSCTMFLSARGALHPHSGRGATLARGKPGCLRDPNSSKRGQSSERRRRCRKAPRSQQSPRNRGLSAGAKLVLAGNGPGSPRGRKGLGWLVLVVFGGGPSDLRVYGFGEPSERAFQGIHWGVFRVPDRVGGFRTALSLTVRLITGRSSVQIRLGPLPDRESRLLGKLVQPKRMSQERLGEKLSPEDERTAPGMGIRPRSWWSTGHSPS